MTLAEHVIEDKPRVHRWTRDEYYRMADAGVFHGHRVELIEGLVVDMAPQNDPHYRAVDKAADVLRAVFPASGFWVRAQGPLNLGTDSAPEPDIAVARGPRDSHPGRPTSAVLIVEVSDTTLRFDRQIKPTLYAKAGIPEYWIISIPDRKLEVFRNPTGSGDDARYASFASFSPTEVISPLATPSAQIRVADLLP